MTILVIAEHDNATLKPATLNVIAAAKKLGQEVHVLVAGHNAGAVATAAASAAGVTKVISADAPHLANFLAENVTPLVVGVAKNYSHILFPSTANGKNVAPRVAALLDSQQISDVSAILSADSFERPIYAGNAIATVKSSDAIKVLTVRPTNFAASKDTQAPAAIEALAAGADSGLSSFVGKQEVKSARPELTAAGIVVSGGRAVGSAENFNKYIEALADALGAAVGASRAAVDAGFAPNDYQVGQTGKTVAPSLYIAVGISGAIQHLAGMKDSKIIVAINKDPDAPIFQVADFGLVADYQQAVPALIAELQKLQKPQP